MTLKEEKEQDKNEEKSGTGILRVRFLELFYSISRRDWQVNKLAHHTNEYLIIRKL